MNDASTLVARYLEAWNESDAARRARRVAELWSADARYTDPLADVRGHEAISGLIGAVQQHYPGHRFEPHGAVDAHGRYLRFSWQLCDAGGRGVARGTDFAELLDDRRLRSVTGFLDQTSQ
jgi:hypothetical protein